MLTKLLLPSIFILFHFLPEINGQKNEKVGKYSNFLGVIKPLNSFNNNITGKVYGIKPNQLSIEV